jgi:hypothetical protein
MNRPVAEEIIDWRRPDDIRILQAKKNGKKEIFCDALSSPCAVEKNDLRFFPVF